VAVAEVAGERAQLKWPNDVLVAGLKVAGILVEGRPQEAWLAVGIGINVALRDADLEADELRGRAGTLGLEPDAVQPTLAALLVALERWLPAPVDSVLDAVRARDALLGKPVAWADGEGTGAGIDRDGRLLVRARGGALEALSAGEIHLHATGRVASDWPNAATSSSHIP
ncbi:MAG: biotin--[acetyl-CoA-carboxylase] ligase, partial [Solirubrobacteraceae bacterium]